MIADLSRAIRLVDQSGRLTPEGWAELMRLVQAINAQETTLDAHQTTLDDHETRIVALEP